MDELNELIRQQTSYSKLVDWLQRQEGCGYMAACTKLNQILRQYRARYVDPQMAQNRIRPNEVR